ncbi:MAG: exodeoxyribonuclease VII large subunit [Propionibacteriaceae bacterium]|jgi:exodeoxyribonuclease VII large subunit|nr:exodeoxyribonuclease VII large subunit [Propionibacteriaceae bacterium]
MPLTSTPEHPVPLREVAVAVKGWVERLGAIWVSAQVIELSRKTGVTHFLTLRDLREEVSVAVTLSTAVLDAAGPVSEGMAVTAQLRPTVWLKSGRLSYECADLRPTGEGQLLARIEHLKRLLQAEGLFSPALKRHLPLLPRGIGLITAKDSAAERDVVVNVRLRWPAAPLLVRYCLMQGPSSALQIIEAVGSLDADPGVDVIIIARGGGSVEDLLPFSDEGLVRAVAGATTPVVSAIGHETDTPVLDLVADVRASTPTDAAKRVVPDVRDELDRIRRNRQHLAAVALGYLQAQWTSLQSLRRHPVLRNPLSRFDVYAEQVSALRRRLEVAATTRFDRESAAVESARTLVRTLGPTSVLTRGYAILVDDDGRTVSSTGSTTAGAGLTAYVTDGTLALIVQSKETHDHP